MHAKNARVEYRGMTAAVLGYSTADPLTYAIRVYKQNGTIIDKGYVPGGELKAAAAAPPAPPPAEDPPEDPTETA